MQAILTLIENMSFVQENQLHDNDELADAVGRLGLLEVWYFYCAMRDVKCNSFFLTHQHIQREFC